jgi:hypothetical protein
MSHSSGASGSVGVGPRQGHHPNFEELSDVLTRELSCRYDREIGEATRAKEMLVMIVRGHHQSAQANVEQVGKLLSKDVRHGFSMVLLMEVVPLAPGAMVQPTGLAEQWVLNKKGDRMTKHRITQDLTHAKTDKDYKLSVNSRIDMVACKQMICRWRLPRIIHFIVTLFLAWPWRAIFICKHNCSNACRRIAHSAKAMAQTITVLSVLAFVCILLTFGGVPNVPIWCCFSEMITDLANKISACQGWDCNVLRSPDHATTPEPKRLAASAPFGPAQPMAVCVPPIVTGKADCRPPVFCGQPDVGWRETPPCRLG